ncbi:SulP family inorganic anion transporter [Denitromonas sp.]|uniref:SulP family inorganic anion transporter n=1 Tax=Denitromonas sp. TaxID=2734609 RepID=UPI003A882D01
MTAPISRLDRLLPFLRWRHDISPGALRADALAGLSVALVTIPQSLAYAQLAGFPAHYGLYAAMLPAIIGVLFGSCPQLSTGPVALTGMLTAASVAPLATMGSDTYLTLAIAIGLLAGLIQLGLGVLRQGWVLNLLSQPVFAAFINAAALLICFSQLPALLGAAGPREPQLVDEALRILAQMAAPHLPTVAVGAGALLALIVLRRYVPRLPGVLAVVVACTALSALTGFEAGGGAVIGDLPALHPSLQIPALPEWHMIATMLPAAFVLAMVSFLEAASSAKLIAEKTGEPWNENQELIGQGLAKLGAAASGTLPTSASFSRSALNLANGARTGVASLVSALAVLLAALAVGPWLHHLPLAVLAAVILDAVGRLFQPAALIRAWRIDADDGLAASATFVATLAFAPNIQNGILTGLLLSLALLIWRSMKPRIALLGLHEDGTHRDLERFGLPHPHPHLVVLRFDGPLHFVNAARFREAVNWARTAQPDVRVVLVSAAGINAIDATGLDAVRREVANLQANGQQLAFCGLKKQVIDVLERDSLWADIAPHATYRHERQAIDALAPLADPPENL